MKKMGPSAIGLIALFCMSGAIPQKEDPQVAITKESAPAQEEKSEELAETPQPERKIGAAKKILRGLSDVNRKGAAQKIREGLR